MKGRSYPYGAHKVQSYLVFACLSFFNMDTNSAQDNSTVQRQVVSIVSLRSYVDATSHQVVEATRMAVAEASKNSTVPPASVLSAVVGDPRNERDLLDDYLTQLHDSTSAAVTGLSTASIVDFMAATMGVLNVPVITTRLSPRRAWNGTYYQTLLFAPPADDHISWVVRDILHYFLWTSVCVIYSNDFSSFSAMEEFLLRVAPAYSITVRKIRIEFDGFRNVTLETQTSFTALTGACNISVVAVNTPELLPVMRLARKNNLLGIGTAWLFVDFQTAPELLPSELVEYMDGSLVVRPRPVDGNDKRLLQFAQRLKRFNSSAVPCSAITLDCVSLEAVYAYEATVQLSKALQRWSLQPVNASETAGLVEISENLTLSLLPNGEWLMGLLRRSVWNSVLGVRSFNASPAQHGYDVFNLHNGRLVKVTEWVANGPTRGLSAFNIETVHWPGGSTAIPESLVPINKTLKILVPDAPPFTSIIRSPPRSNDDFGGVAVEVLKNASGEAGFDYSLQLWNDSWDEMLKVVGDEAGEYDMAIGSLTVRGYRTKLCDFTSRIFFTGIRMAVLRPVRSPKSPWEFFNPFHWTVWLSIATTIFLSALLMRILDPAAIATGRTGHWLSDAIYFTTNVYLFVHGIDEMDSKVARFFLIFLQFAMHVLSAAYTANMASFLSDAQDKPVSSYKEIFYSPVGCRASTTNWQYAKQALSLKGLVDVQTSDEAVEALRSGKVKAYIADIPDLEVIAAKHCDIIVVGNKVDIQEYAFATRKNFHWASTVNSVLNSAITNGVLDKSYKKHINNHCPAFTKIGDSTPLSLLNIGGVFILGAIAAGVMAGFKLIPLINNRRRPRLPLHSVHGKSSNVVSRPPSTKSRLTYFTNSLPGSNIFDPSVKDATLDDFTFADGSALETVRERPPKYYYVH